MKEIPALIIFSFKREKNTLKILQAVKNLKNQVYVFHDFDGSKKNLNLAAKLKTLSFIKLKIRKDNFGLKKNLISGISYVTKFHKSFIVIEDDLYVDEILIEKFNSNLEVYKDCPKVLQVSCFPMLGDNVSNYPTKVPVGTSWAWGSWSDKWMLFLGFMKNNNNTSFLNKIRIDYFFRYPFSYLLYLESKNKISSWAIHMHVFSVINRFQCLYFYHDKFNFVSNIEELSTHGPNNFKILDLGNDWKKNLLIMSGSSRFFNFLKFLKSCLN